MTGPNTTPGDDRPTTATLLADEIERRARGDIADGSPEDLTEALNRWAAILRTSVVAIPGDDRGRELAARQALIPSIERALFGTEDGGMLGDDESSIPVGCFRQLLREVWAPRALAAPTGIEATYAIEGRDETCPSCQATVGTSLAYVLDEHTSSIEDGPGSENPPTLCGGSDVAVHHALAATPPTPEGEAVAQRLADVVEVRTDGSGGWAARMVGDPPGEWVSRCVVASHLLGLPRAALCDGGAPAPASPQAEGAGGDS